MLELWLPHQSDGFRPRCPRLRWWDGLWPMSGTTNHRKLASVTRENPLLEIWENHPMSDLIPKVFRSKNKNIIHPSIHLAPSRRRGCWWSDSRPQHVPSTPLTPRCSVEAPGALGVGSWAAGISIGTIDPWWSMAYQWFGVGKSAGNSGTHYFPSNIFRLVPESFPGKAIYKVVTNHGRSKTFKKIKEFCFLGMGVGTVEEKCDLQGAGLPFVLRSRSLRSQQNVGKKCSEHTDYMLICCCNKDSMSQIMPYQLFGSMMLMLK